MNPIIEQAGNIALGGRSIGRELAMELAAIGGEEILDLASLANKVRNRHAPFFQACSIMNIKSGLCSENCRFCAQSAAYDTPAENYPMAEPETMLAAARKAYEKGIRSFCLVASGYGMKEPDADFEKVVRAIRLIHGACPGMGVSACLGVLSSSTASILAAEHIEHYNINLQTSPAKYGELIATTHSVEERRATIKLLKQHGVTICSGGIFGVGETMDDRVELALALSDLEVDIIPINVLLPIPGTPLAGHRPMAASEVLKTIAIFRLLNPRQVIKLAAGRETVMSDFQGLLMLSGANGFITGGYLTTRGRDVERDMRFLADLRAFGVSSESVSVT